MQGYFPLRQPALPVRNAVQLLLKLLQHRFDNLLRRTLFEKLIGLREQVPLKTVPKLAVLRNRQSVHSGQPRT
ncbi:hypothetical protein D3C73_1453690 [compost metagenome]